MPPLNIYGPLTNRRSHGPLTPPNSTQHSSPDREKGKGNCVKWELKGAQIMLWILRDVETSIFPNLKPYKSPVEIWSYLKKVYN